jgi:hypothetical protein
MKVPTATLNHEFVPPPLVEKYLGGGIQFNLLPCVENLAYSAEKLKFLIPRDPTNFVAA